jgi:agmatine deiminase
MKKHLLIFGLIVMSTRLIAQQEGYTIPEHILPKWSTEAELRHLRDHGFEISRTSRGIETPPPYPNLRNMAEWEEIQALTIAWTAYPTILKQIVAAAKQETKVIILASNPSNVESYLLGTQAGFSLPNLNNVEILQAQYNSVWLRDYAGNPVYGNEVDDLIMVDWIYNRPNRPLDDASPAIVAEHLDLELYCTTSAPTDLVNTGGNFMSDGFGTAFASKLIQVENQPGNTYGVTAKTPGQIDGILQDFQGIHTFIKMDELPFDNISHIDMHMKLLDEERLLVGKFPDGVSDGPQIQANMEFVLSNYTTKWGTPWKIVWVPMVPNNSGNYPNGTLSGPSYRTFTNSVFVNKTVIIPTYREAFDTIAMRIYAEQLPGYTLVPIDCDNQPDNIIAASGAIHCITHSVGVADPLLISHKPLSDTDDNVNPYQVVAYIKHRTGIQSATLHYKFSETGPNQSVAMSSIGDDNWQGEIPAQPFGTTVYYYVEGLSESGKTQVRPIAAPEGYWKFRVLSELVDIPAHIEAAFAPAYPNPANAITCVPVTLKHAGQANLSLYDIMGREVLTIFSGEMPRGESKYFFDAKGLSAGSYLIVLQSQDTRIVQKLMVK